MHPCFQVLERNPDLFSTPSRVLVLNPPSGPVADCLQGAPALSNDYKVSQSYERYANAPCYFGLDALAQHPCDDSFEAVVLFMPKSKGEFDLLFSFARSVLKAGQAFYLVGEKKGGIASASKKLPEYGSAMKVDFAKHCQLWQVDLDEAGKPFNLDDWLSEFSVEFAGNSLSFCTMPGVFSFERLDEGSALLLQSLEGKRPKRLEQRILDFGCGVGVLGICAKTMYPEISLEQVDINWLALECTKRSLSANGLEAKVYASDGWSEVSGRVNGVVTNPPFHSGIKTEYDTSETFLKQAPQKMSKHAPLLVVANRFLKYPAIIESSFGRCDTVEQTGKFNVYLTFR